MKTIRIGFGLAVWIAAAAALAVWLGVHHRQHVRQQWLPQLWRFSTGTRHVVRLTANERLPLSAGDPIFVEWSPGEFRQVGEVHRSASGAIGRTSHAASEGTKALFYPDAPPPDQIHQLTYYRTPQSMEWVIQTMLPVEKRQLLVAEMTAAFQEHHEEIIASLRPLVEASLRDALVVVEDDLPASLARHQPDLQRIGARYQRDMVERDIVPLVRDEIWPIVQRDAGAAAHDIGQEIWQRASLWRFGWRLAYDRSPLPEKQLARQEWTRFLHDDAIPVLQDHADEMVRIQQRILADVAKNKEVQRVVRESVAEIVNDSELQQVVWRIIRDLLVDNPRIHEVFHRHWQSPAAHAAFQRIGQRLEPVVTRIGEILIGTPEDGITPEFARVLRNRVLGKEQRWLVVELAEAASAVRQQTGDRPATLAVRRGLAPVECPFVKTLDRRQ